MSGPTIIRLAGYQAAQSVHSQALNLFAARVADKAGTSSHVNVAFNLDVTLSGTQASDLPHMVASGAVDAAYIASSYVTGVPALQVLDLPFQFKNFAALSGALDSVAGRTLSSEIATKTPFKVLGYWNNGLRHITNNVRPIRTPEDCRGLKIRVLDSAALRCGFMALGFDPVTIDVRNLTDAVASGQVDAQENPLTNILLFGLHRYHRYVTLSGHLAGVAIFLCNRRRFDRWPKAVRVRVLRAAREATVLQRRLAAEEDDRCRATLQAEGVAFHTLDSGQSGLFRSIMERETGQLPSAVGLPMLNGLLAHHDVSAGHAVDRPKGCKD